MICCGQERKTNFCPDCGKKMPEYGQKMVVKEGLEKCALESLVTYCESRSREHTYPFNEDLWSLRKEALAELISKNETYDARLAFYRERWKMEVLDTVIDRGYVPSDEKSEDIAESIVADAIANWEAELAKKGDSDDQSG